MRYNTYLSSGMYVPSFTWHPIRCLLSCSLISQQQHATTRRRPGLMTVSCPILYLYLFLCYLNWTQLFWNYLPDYAVSDIKLMTSYQLRTSLPSGRILMEFYLFIRIFGKKVLNYCLNLYESVIKFIYNICIPKSISNAFFSKWLYLQMFLILSNF